MRISTSIKHDPELNFVALVGGTPAEVKGKRTMPSHRIYDPDFQYQPACKTACSTGDKKPLLTKSVRELSAK